MEAPRNFKFDVRIRGRLLAKGQVTEAEVGKHLDALADLEAASEVVTLSQPAIGIPPERPRPMPRPVQPKPIARPVVPVDALDEAWDDEDDDEEDLKPKKAVTVAAARPGKVELEGEPKKASPDDDEDDLDSEDKEEGASEDEE